MTHFKTTNMGRFTWKRQRHGTILIRSLKTGIEYYKSPFDRDEWQRATWRLQMRATARKVVRLEQAESKLHRSN
jgi:hypothetical protein